MFTLSFRHSTKKDNLCSQCFSAANVKETFLSMNSSVRSVNPRKQEFIVERVKRFCFPFAIYNCYLRNISYPFYLILKGPLLETIVFKCLCSVGSADNEKHLFMVTKCSTKKCSTKIKHYHDIGTRRTLSYLIKFAFSEFHDF